MTINVLTLEEREGRVGGSNEVIGNIAHRV